MGFSRPVALRHRMASTAQATTTATRSGGKPPKSWFIDLPLDIHHIHLYLSRNAIYKAMRDALPNMRGTLLDVGCGFSPYKPLFLSNPNVTKYIGLDLAVNPVYANQPDLVWDGQTIPLPDASVQTMIATELLEHVPNPDRMLREMHRVLEPGGSLFFTVPFLWALHDVPHDEYRYTPFALRRLLAGAGFEVVDIRATGGWNASLVQVFANWAYYSPTRRIWRGAALVLLWPFVRLLIRTDRIPTEFKTNQLVTGFSGWARRPKASTGA